jgi:hypothetical protein
MTTMTDDELRVAIAKARGWTVYHYDKDHRDSCYFCLLNGDGYPVNDDYMNNHHQTEAEAWADCPDYPRDLNTAFELVQDAEEQDVWFALANVIPNSDTVMYEVKFTLDCKWWYACADTPARAICEAWLQWKESEGQG